VRTLAFVCFVLKQEGNLEYFSQVKLIAQCYGILPQCQFSSLRKM